MADHTLSPTQSEQIETVGEWRDDDGDLAEQIAAGTCPWCDEYDGEHVGRHASSAHPEEWEAYTDD